MPRLLAVNCERAIVEALRSVPGYEVIDAVHGNVAGDHDPLLGDPGLIDLIVHGCRMYFTGYGFAIDSPDGYDEDDLEALAKVNDSFLTEAARLGAIGVHLVSDQVNKPNHYSGGRGRQAGHQIPILQPTDRPDASLLHPFIDAFEQDFGSAVLSDDIGYDVLVANQYDEPIVVLQQSPTLLALPRVDADDRQVDLAVFLAARTLPALFPQILADQVRTEKLAELEGKVGLEIARHQERLSELHTGIEEERQFAARYAALGSTMDDALKLNTLMALTEVFGLEVEDLDAKYPDAKNGDLLVAGHSIVIETRGSQTRNASKNDVENVSSHADTLVDLGTTVRAKVLVFNGLLARPLARRGDPFSRQVREEAKTQGVALFTGPDLLGRVGRMRDGSYSADDLIEEFTRP